MEATVFSSLCIIVGLIWDISWHTSIGRDGLLSPPHLLIYLGAVVSGVFSGYRVLKVSFAGSLAEKGQSVRFWGIFHGSTGALFCIWGAFAMLTSAPFDDWWHNTYGLDVVILSPPHVVLALGIMMVQFGAMIGVLALQNRNENPSGWSLERIERRNFSWRLLFVVAAGLLLVTLFTMASDSLDRFSMHHSSFYQVASLVFPLLLVAAARASQLRWAATATAGVYSAILALLVWILPLFPAEPKLGPVLNHLTHYQAFHFPLLLVFPALALDWLLNRFAGKNDWLLSVVMGFAFLVVLLAVQWPMGNLLMSPVGRSWVFGQESWYFGNDPTWEYRFKYASWNLESTPGLLKGLGIALAIGVVSARLGLAWGKWMQNIQR
ncbi:MAG: hypothetical protein H7Z75_03380 [Ferruginibacter sp.]|nr:hypothetical protein [Cytophagales bacterium]